MTLKIGWLHEAENDLGTWLHEADDWQPMSGGMLIDHFGTVRAFAAMRRSADGSFQ